jgi:DNA-binding IclR family transcriptional regulator
VPVDRRPSIPISTLTRLLRIARAHMTELTREFRESTALGIMFDNHIEIVAVVESPQIVRMANTTGRILQPHASSIGKSIAAFQSEERRERLLRSYGITRVTANTITDETRLREEFERIRKQGYSIDNEETAPDGLCFGAPIFLGEHEVPAALSMSLPVMRAGSDERRQQLIAAVMRTARAISGQWS